MKELMAGLIAGLKPKYHAVSSYLKALKAYEAGDYTTALNEWHPLAEQGNARAQANIAAMYDTGTGVKQNKAEAERWYLLAAKQGNANAQYWLGEMYDQDPIVPVVPDEKRDNLIAERWYRLAAEQGHSNAQWRLGAMYYFGCDNGSEFVLGRDVTEAERWFRLAAKQGNAAGQHMLGQMYWDTNSDLDMDAAESLRWCRLAAKQGYAPAQIRLGRMYSAEIPYFVQRDTVEAVRWFRLAAEQGDASGQWALGQLYATGDGVPKDLVLAHMWCKISIFGHGEFIDHLDLPEFEELEKELTRDEIAAATQRAKVCMESNYRNCG